MKEKKESVKYFEKKESTDEYHLNTLSSSFAYYNDYSLNAKLLNNISSILNSNNANYKKEVIICPEPYPEEKI